MAIWFVNRNTGKLGPITSAHQDHMVGYNDEALDDLVSVELQNFLAACRVVPDPSTAANMADKQARATLYAAAVLAGKTQADADTQYKVSFNALP